MTFNPSQHPRDASGQFSEKTGQAPEVGLTGERSVVTARIRQNVFNESREFVGYDETYDFNVEPILDTWTLQDVEEMYSDNSYGRLYDGIVANKLADESFTNGRYGEILVSEDTLGAYIAHRKARELTKPEPSKGGSFRRVNSLAELDETFDALISPENLYMDGELDLAGGRRRYASYAADYASRAAEVAKSWDYHIAAQRAVEVMQVADTSSRSEGATMIRTAASRTGANATLFSGGKPQVEASGHGTVLITGTRGGVVTVPKGSDPTIIVSVSAITTIVVEDGARARILSDSPNLEVADAPGVTFVGRKRGVYA